MKILRKFSAILLSISFLFTAGLVPSVNAVSAEGEAVAQNKGRLADFEAGGQYIIDSPYAVSGSNVYEYPANKSYHDRNVASISSNPYVEEATGISLWAYNPGDTAARIKAGINNKNPDGKTDGYHIGYTLLQPHTYAKLSVSFSDIAQLKTDHYQTGGGSRVSLDAAAKSRLDYVFVNSTSSKNANPVYIDDVYLTFDKINALPDTETIDFSSLAVTGDARAVDGKLVFDSAPEGSRRVARVTVPQGFFRGGKLFTVNYDADVTASIAVKLLGTNDQGAAAHWKWGYLAGGATFNTEVGEGISRNLSLMGKNKYETHTMHEDIGESCSTCTPASNSSHGSNPPSPAEKATVHTLVFEVFGNVGESGKAVTVNSITLTRAANTVSVVQPENGGTISVSKETAWAGDSVFAILNLESGYYVKSFAAFDTNGNEIPFEEKNDASNLSNYKCIVMPEANVTFSAELLPIDKTVFEESSYCDSTDYKFEFSVPVNNGLVYNQLEEVDDYKKAENCGVIIASKKALDKYGFTAEDLTLDFVNELIRNKHHLANYMCVINCGKNNAGILSKMNTGCDFGVRFTDVTAEIRRSDIAVSTFVIFEGDVPDYYNPTVASLDKRHYGENMPQGFFMEHGISLSQDLQGGIISLTNTSAILQQETWDAISEHGFDHVRLPMQIGKIVDDNGILDEATMKKIDKIIDCAVRAGLTLILDPAHKYKDLEDNFTANYGEFLGVWHQLAVRYKDLPECVAFEIINEPYCKHEKGAEHPDPLTNDRLMTMQETVLDDIRSVKGNETRMVVIKPAYDNPSNLSDVSDKLANAENCVLSIHDYTPMNFTSSGADWTKDENGNIKYPGGATTYGSYYKTRIQWGVDFCKEHPNLTLWLGEWGVYKPDYEAKLRYMSEHTAFSASCGYAWCLWEYGTAWGPYSRTTGEWDEDMLEALGIY